MSLQIITNNRTRDFLYGYEVPESVLSDYDHLEECEQADHWIKYKGRYYHISDFMTLSYNHPFEGWHGVVNDSFFSGVLIRTSSDCENYQIATFIS